MSTIPALASNLYLVQRNGIAEDSDGDGDSSRRPGVESTVAQAQEAPIPPKPTETIGNSVNTYA